MDLDTVHADHGGSHGPCHFDAVSSGEGAVRRGEGGLLWGEFQQQRGVLVLVGTVAARRQDHGLPIEFPLLPVGHHVDTRDVLIPRGQPDHLVLRQYHDLLRSLFPNRFDRLLQRLDNSKADRQRLSLLGRGDPVKGEWPGDKETDQWVRGTECPPQRLMSPRSTPFSSKNSMATRDSSTSTSTNVSSFSRSPAVMVSE